MSIAIIRERLKLYNAQTIEEEEDALKEILQEIVLYSLSTTSFFNEAIFHGGTSLRILYGLPRFSEDLDFLLRTKNSKFHWKSYLHEIMSACKTFGIQAEVKDKSELGKTVQKMFLKDNSIGKLLNLTFHHHARKKLTIKLEIDTNPPKGSNVETKFLDFPLDSAIAIQDLPSNFAGKFHALLCREYIKGRDWFDFAWYVTKKIKPNLLFLSNAIEQQGPWAGKKIPVSTDWLKREMESKIKKINWLKAVEDVMPFLKGKERQTLALWNKDFFLDKLQKFISLYDQEL